MVLVTERRKALGAMTCEICNGSHPGGVARGVVLDEPGGDTHGFSGCSLTAGRSPIMSRSLACPAHQLDPLLQIMRFADSL
jgi:hypothetical protein